MSAEAAEQGRDLATKFLLLVGAFGDRLLPEAEAFCRADEEQLGDMVLLKSAEFYIISLQRDIEKVEKARENLEAVRAITDSLQGLEPDDPGGSELLSERGRALDEITGFMLRRHFGESALADLMPDGLKKPEMLPEAREMDFRSVARVLRVGAGIPERRGILTRALDFVGA